MVIDTVYDGEDLAEVGQLTGLGSEGVIAAHSGQIWTVAFAGFAPGFGYMLGENQALDVPAAQLAAHRRPRRLRGAGRQLFGRLPAPLARAAGS